MPQQSAWDVPQQGGWGDSDGASEVMVHHYMTPSGHVPDSSIKLHKKADTLAADAGSCSGSYSRA